MESKSKQKSKQGSQKSRGNSNSGSRSSSNGNSEQSFAEQSGQQDKSRKGFLRSLFKISDDATSIKELFIKGLKDIYNAEQQLVEALPEMSEAAYNEQLQDAFMDHREETMRQAKRIEKICSRLNIDLSDAETCKAMEGLIEEGQEIIKDFKEGAVRDAALIIGAQKIEHYEIAAYGSLRTIAEVMGLYEISDMLDRTLEEEERTDMLLTEIAEEINDAALYYDELDEEQGNEPMREKSKNEEMEYSS
jgi:ferritin-like metal-binding protein YciE